MARNMYGATSADFTLTSGGRVVPGATLTIWSARTGGTQITDLLDVDSVATTTVTSDADGSIVYYGPNNDKTVHWADSGVGNRIAIRPVDITGDPPVLSIGTVGTGAAAASLTGTSEAPVLNLTLPPAANDSITSAMIAANAVGSSELADNAVDSAAIATGAVTPDKLDFGSVLSASQTDGTAAIGMAECTRLGNVFTASGTAAFTAAYTAVPVTVGETYLFRVDYSALGRTVAPTLSWRDSGGTLIANAYGNTVPAGSDGVAICAGVAPVGATQAHLYIISSTGTGSEGDAITVDRVDFWPVRQSGAPSDAVDLQGYGSPETAVKAPAGSTFLPLDARSRRGGRWRKSSGPLSSYGWKKPAVDIPPWRFAGLHVVPPELAGTLTLTLGTNNIFVHMFQAADDVVVTGMSMASGTTATSGTTFARFGLWHVGDHKDVQHNQLSATLLARTDSDTGLFATGQTKYTRAWSTTGGYPAAVRLRKGEWYGAGYAVLASSPGQLIGLPYPRAQVQAAPVLGWRTGGWGDLTDLFPMVSGASMVYDGGALCPWMHLTVDPASTVAEAIPVALLGDSIPSTYAGWFAWANCQTGSRLLPVLNAARAGLRLDQTLAEIPAYIGPAAPDAVILHGGVNDINQGASAATVQGRFTAVFDALDALGVPQIICCTIPSATDLTTEEKADLLTVNTWLTGLSRAGVTVADTGMALTTGDGVTADATKLADTVHPNLAGQQAMADVLDDVLAAL